MGTEPRSVAAGMSCAGGRRCQGSASRVGGAISWIAVVAPFRLGVGVISWSSGLVSAPAAAPDISCDGLGCRSAGGAGQAVFDVGVAEPGRTALRARCCESLGHFFAERPDVAVRDGALWAR